MRKTLIIIITMEVRLKYALLMQAQQSVLRFLGGLGKV